MNKKLLQLASMLLVAVCLCVNFTACGDDDDEKEGRGGGSNGKENGYAWVDLGLPSGLKWATCNVGAANSWDYGDYFAWGETTSKSIYSSSTYLDGRITSDEDYGTEKDLLRGIDDIAGTQYDAARAKMGGKWRMPTKDEMTELFNNCYWEWKTNYNGTGVNGYIVYKVKYVDDKGIKKYRDKNVTTLGTYSLENDTHIFLPAAGYRYSELYRAGYYGCYCSSSLYTYLYNSKYYYDFAYCMEFLSDEVGLNGHSRSGGHSVRGVCK